MQCFRIGGFTTKSIRTKLFMVFALILILSLGAVTLLWYLKSTQTTTRLVNHYAFELIKEANDNFELTLRDIDYLSTVISLNRPNILTVLADPTRHTSYEQLQVDRRVDDFIASLYGYKYYISSILIVGVNGKSYSQGTTLSAADVRVQPWYREMVRNIGGRIFLKTHSASQAGQAAVFPSQNVISIARAIVDDGRFLGVVLIDFRYDIAQKIFNAKIPWKNSLFVVDRQGAFIYDPHNRFLNVTVKKTGLRHLVAQLKGEEGSFTTRFNQEEMFVVYYKSGYTQWTTIGMISKNSMMQEAVKTTSQALFITCIALVVVIAAANLIALAITRNIFRLRDAMKRIGQGDFNVRAVVRTGDEIAELSLGFNAMVAEIQKLLQDVRDNERQKRLAELKAYQAQINPHFLSNTLNTVRWLANAQKADNIGNLVVSLIQLLQVSMSGEDFIPLRREIEYVKEYVNIQQYRYCDKFKVQYQIEPEILDCRIPKFILQPIVENALIHGIEPLEGQGLIVIKGYRENDAALGMPGIAITITDNGVGMPTDQIAAILKQEHNRERMRFSSIGIYNVAERLRMYFGGADRLRIESAPGIFTTVTLTIPINEQEGEATSVSSHVG